MTTSDPGTTPAGPQSDPTQPASEPGARAPQQEGPWAPQQQQPGAWYPPQQQPGAWYPPQSGASAAPGAATGGLKKWLRIGLPIAVVGVVGLGSFVGFADPEVGDCVQMAGDTDFDVVDCGSAEAEYRIVGIEGDEQTYPAFMADPDTCVDFASTEVALWIGALETEPGTVFCAEPV